MGSTSTGYRTSGVAALIAAVGTLLLLVLGPVATAHAAGDDADITVDLTCDSVEVASSKDISNVVVSFADGSTEKFDGLSGHSWSRVFARGVAGVWVKSGDNASGDGPGYGEWFPTDADCGGQEPATQDQEPAEGTEPDGGPDRPEREAAPQDTGASITVELDCLAVIVESSKDISNVVVSFADGSTEKFDGLSGHSWSRVFARGVAGVWVKSGDNASGDGPGYGEWFPTDADCDEQPASGQQPDADTEDVASDDVAEAPTGSAGPDAPPAEVAGEADPDTGPAQGSDDVAAPAPDTAVLGVAIDRSVTAAGPDAQVAGMQAAAAPTDLARTGTDAGWLLALAAALAVYGIVALDLTGRRARG